MLISQVEIASHGVEIVLALISLALTFWVRSLDKQQKIQDENIDLKISGRFGEIILGQAAMSKQADKLELICRELTVQVNNLAVAQARIDEQIKIIELISDHQSQKRR